MKPEEKGANFMTIQLLSLHQRLGVTRGDTNINLSYAINTCYNE